MKIILLFDDKSTHNTYREYELGLEWDTRLKNKGLINFTFGHPFFSETMIIKTNEKA